MFASDILILAQWIIFSFCFVCLSIRVSFVVAIIHQKSGEIGATAKAKRESVAVVMTLTRIITDMEYYHFCEYYFQCVFAMFASLFDVLLQTVIALFAPVFDASILNFIQACSGIIAAVFNGLTDWIIEYICAAIYDTYSLQNSGIFADGIDIGLKVVCLFVAAIGIQLQPRFIIVGKLLEQFTAIGIDCIDGLTYTSRCGAMINELLCLFNSVFNFGVLTAIRLINDNDDRNWILFDGCIITTHTNSSDNRNHCN